MALRPRANVISTLVFTCVWPIPGKLYSIGSSTVRIFRLLSLICDKPTYKVVVLPEPVGPVTNMIPCGRARILLIASRSRSEVPRCLRDNLPAFLSSKRKTIRSPLADGMVETRISTSRPPTRREIRPS